MLAIHSTVVLMSMFWLDRLAADPRWWHPALTQQPASSGRVITCCGRPAPSTACFNILACSFESASHVCAWGTRSYCCCRVACHRVLLHQAYVAELAPPCVQVMELAEQLTAVCHERLQLSQRTKDPEPAIVASLDAASKRQQFLEQQLEDAQERTNATQAEKETGEAFRGTIDRECSTMYQMHGTHRRPCTAHGQHKPHFSSSSTLVPCTQPGPHLHTMPGGLVQMLSMAQKPQLSHCLQAPWPSTVR